MRNEKLCPVVKMFFIFSWIRGFYFLSRLFFLFLFFPFFLFFKLYLRCTTFSIDKMLSLPPGGSNRSEG